MVKAGPYHACHWAQCPPTSLAGLAEQSVKQVLRQDTVNKETEARMESIRGASWRRWTFRGVLKGRKEETRLMAAKQGLENKARQPWKHPEKGKGGRGEHTWGVMVQHSITYTDLQDEGSEQLFHMR